MSTQLTAPAQTGTKAISQFLSHPNPFDRVPAIYKIESLCGQMLYVGATINIRRRFWEYRRSKNTNRLRSLEAINDLGADNFKLSILEFINDPSEIYTRERYWIEKIKPNLNKTLGGKGVKGRRLTDEQKLRLSEISKKQWENHPQHIKDKIITNNLKGPSIGHEVKQSTREKLRIANLGKKQSKETIQKRSDRIRISMRGNKNGNKSIIGINKDGDTLEFNSTKEASISLGVNPSCITGVLRGRRKTSCGYSWKYKI